MQSRISNTQMNSRGFGINKFCVASGNQLFKVPHKGGGTPKFLGWPNLWSTVHVLQMIC